MRVAFTATPDLSAAVLFEFNLGTDERYVGHDEFDLGAPTVNVAPGGVGGRDGYRTIRFNHFISAKTSPATEALTDLGRLLMAADGWLLIQLTEDSEPRWARTWRSSPGSLSIQSVTLREDYSVVAGQWMIPVSLTADPLLVGESMALVAAANIDNSPSGADPHVLVLPEVQGDAPAPAVVTYEYDNDPESTTVMVQTTPVHATYSAPIILEDDDATLLFYDDTSPVTSVVDSGGTYSLTAFDSGPFDDGDPLMTWEDQTVPPGHYLVLLLWRSDTAPISFDAAFDCSVDGGAVHATCEDSVSLAKHWAPLGVLRLPFTGAPDELLDASADATVDLRLTLTRISGTGEAQIDAVMLIPCPTHARVLYVDHVSGVPLGPPRTVDGEYEAEYTVAADGSFAVDRTRLRGGFPLLYPGEGNALHLVQGIRPGLGSAGGVILDQSAAVTVSYRPRWLWLAP